jgi:hypothetical protein
VSGLLIALLGVVAGAVSTGLLQLAQTLRERRLKVRIAARLLNGELILVGKDLERIASEGRWPDKVELDFAPLLETWRVHREAFAAGVDGIDWNDVAIACRHLSDVGGAQVPGEPLSATELKSLERLIARVDRASDVTIRRSYTKREGDRLATTYQQRRLATQAKG